MALEFSKPVRLGKNLGQLQLAGEINGAAPQPRVLITDDQTLFRAGLARLHAADARLRVLNPTDDGLDTVERTLRRNPDMVVIDVQFPSTSREESSTFEVVVLAADFDQETARAGQGNEPKSASGHEVIADAVVSRILAFYASKDQAAPARKPDVSKRELSVLSYVAAGRSNKQIGSLLGISQKTVRNHLSRIFHKLGASNRTEAVMNAMRLGLIIV